MMLHLKFHPRLKILKNNTIVKLGYREIFIREVSCHTISHGHCEMLLMKG